MGVDPLSTPVGPGLPLSQKIGVLIAKMRILVDSQLQ
jgi:hypothetical protein